MTSATKQPPAHSSAEQPKPVFRPAVDIIESEDAVILLADMPGVDDSTVEVTLEKRVLTISGRAAPLDVAGFRPVFREYGEGDFERAFTLSNDIDRDGIEATVKNGLLRIRLPKAPQVVSRKIAVSAQ